MGRPVRMYVDDGIYFVTARVTQGRFLLRPDEKTNALVGGVLARAAGCYPVELHAYVVTSNHVHLLLRAKDGCLSAFMQFLLGNIARKVGRLVNWGGTLWERRFSEEIVLDDAAAEVRLRYILAHGVKEGLVRHATDWPGLSCVTQLLGSLRRKFKWFHWARRWQGRRILKDALGLFDDALAEDIELELKLLPAWEALSDGERIARTRAMLDEIESAARKTHKAVVGAEKVASQHPHNRPKFVKRSPRPLCHASTKATWLAWLFTYKAFRDAYRQASARYRCGDNATMFPGLAFRPPLIRGVTVSLAA